MTTGVDEDERYVFAMVHVGNRTRIYRGPPGAKGKWWANAPPLSTFDEGTLEERRKKAGFRLYLCGASADAARLKGGFVEVTE
jgi:hypothetical protein